MFPPPFGGQRKLKSTKLNLLDTVNTLFLGKVVQYFEELPSTNVRALEWLQAERPPEGALVITDHQTAGRGQMNNSWETQAGANLTFSVLLYPHFLPLQQQFALNQAVTLAVRDAAEVFLPRSPQIKWPNDVYIGGKKLAGILIQNQLRGLVLDASVVGIGLNVNQTEFSPHLPNPTSLRLECGRPLELEAVLHTLLSHLETRYLQLKAGRQDELLLDYYSHLYRFQEEGLYRDRQGRLFRGRITGVSPQGKLLVATAEGERAFANKEIEFV